MKVFVLEREVWLPAPRPSVFAYFADAANLVQLTPPALGFELLTPPPALVATGARFAFRVRVRGLPVRWQSVVTRCEPPVMFVDEQVRGPYRLWRHEHHFAEGDGGTAVRDEVRWAVRLPWLLGALVRRDLERVFDYRAEAIRRRFATG